MSHCTYPRCACKATGIYCKSKPASGKKAPKPIAKQSVKGKQKAIEKKALVQNDMALYLEIWEERPHIDFETGESILKPLIQNFHHVLEKAQFPQYRHSKWNIVLVKDETHNQVHSNIDKTPKIKALRAQLLELHQNNKLKP